MRELGQGKSFLALSDPHEKSASARSLRGDRENDINPQTMWTRGTSRIVSQALGQRESRRDKGGKREKERKGGRDSRCMRSRERARGRIGEQHGAEEEEK